MDRYVFDFNKLKNFMIIAEAESVSDAARKLNRTQSAISQQLQALEAELGLRLLERRGGQMHLTREGKQIYERLRPQFDQMEGSIHAIRGRMDLVTGVIKVGATPTVCDYLLVPYLKEFNLKHPDICIELVLLPDEGLERLLREDSIDFAFIIEFKERDLFQVTPFKLFEETLVGSPAYLARWSRECNRGVGRYADLKDAHFIDFGADVPNVRHWLRKNTAHYRQILESKRPLVVVEDYDSVRRLVLGGSGFAVLPNYMTIDDLEQRHLVEIFPKAQRSTTGVDFAVRKKKNLDLAMKLFSEYIQRKIST